MPSLDSWWRMIGDLSIRVKASFVLLWLLLSLAILLAALFLTEESRQQQFESATLHIKKTLEERLLICETAIYGYAGLSAADHGSSQNRLRQFAQNIGTRYPYIYLMGLQPTVTLAERASFEAATSFGNKQPFTIRDYSGKAGSGWQDARFWRPAPARPYYIPLADTQPASARRYDFMLGLDLARDPTLGPAVSQAIRSGEIEVTPPFRLQDGEHGFGYLKAIYRDGVLPETVADRQQGVIGIILLGVRAEALLAVQGDNDRQLDLRLLPNNPQQQAGSISSPPAPSISVGSSGWLHKLLQPSRQMQLAIERDYFPYRLEVFRHEDANHIPLPLYGLAMGSAAFITALLLLIAASQNNERLQSERYHETLQRERQQALITLESIDDAVLVLDCDYQVEYLNPKAALLLGVTQTRAVGMQLELVWRVRFELAREAITDPVKACHQQLQRVELPENAYLLRPDGQGAFIEGTVSPLLDPDGALRSIVITFRDMAPLRQRMAEALERSEMRLKQHQAELARVTRINTLGEMTSGIAHEINQPLSAIVSYNEACLSMLDDEEPDRILLKTALFSSVKQAQRAGHIVKKLREFVASKQAELAAVDVNQAVLNVITLIESELRDHAVTIDTDLARDLPRVRADAIQMEQVVMNLCKNAMEALMDLPGERRLFIYSEPRGQRVRVGVRDNGPGMPAETLQKVFQPFFSSKSQGMGLGLTISHTIIENMGGVLHAGNLETGGAEFYFELPMIKPLGVTEGELA
ncbi:CHASE domain-containing protein [Vogesella oryzae]|uniref:CHASE domain-containing protein n=1 Tax=Vogesella oryzae TaxID=1735285 RepID=UPI0015815FB2|nr:CHASE domain-containing protein [Vogesella oryzae]